MVNERDVLHHESSRPQTARCVLPAAMRGGVCGSNERPSPPHRSRKSRYNERDVLKKLPPPLAKELIEILCDLAFH